MRHSLFWSVLLCHMLWLPLSVLATQPDEFTPLNPPLTERVEVFGYSVRGRPLTAYVLGDGDNVTIIFGAFHGNERTTKPLVEQLHAYLRQHPELLAGCQVILVPNVNPDGIAAGTRVNARGVDLNRNFPGSWKPRAGKARYRPGPYAASEPETQAIIRLMKKYQPGKAVNIHSPFHTMNWTGQNSRVLAQLMRQYNRYPMTDDIGYPTPGSFGNYCGKRLQIAIVTLELPVESVAASWKANRDALLAAITTRQFIKPTPNLNQYLQAVSGQVNRGATSIYEKAAKSLPVDASE